MVKGFLIILAAVIFATWWWRRSYVPSPLEVHYADLEMKQRNGNLANLAAYVAYPVTAMMSTGWGTTTQINPNNPYSLTHNKPGKLGLNIRFPQPSH